MNIIIRENNIGHVFEISHLSVYSTLTFCNIKENIALYPLLMRLVKAGIISSFTTRENVIRIAFYNKYVEEIF